MDLGRSGSLILAALGRETFESESEYVRAYAGALLLAEMLFELRNVRRVLTPKE